VSELGGWPRAGFAEHGRHADRGKRPPSEPAIVVRDLVKRYKKADKNAVDGVSFSVQPGEFFALLGPNGAGKTTTISILTTTLAPTSGQVIIGGADAVKQAAAVRRKVGIIFQKPSIDRNLSGEENVRFHAILYGLYPYRPLYRMMPAEYRRQVTDLASLLGLEKEIFKPLKTMSGGMMRKLEIIRGLMHRPRVLFLDEPTAGLDAASRRSLWDYLREVRAKSETTIFLTTHYLDEAEEAERICILDKGRVVKLGTPDEIKADLLQEYLIVDAADRAALCRELERRGLQVRESGPFQVLLDGRSAQEVISSLDTELTVLRIHAPSLEDAYLKIVGAVME
jgi:ABC-2 type transport system ATP-binding protein